MSKRILFRRARSVAQSGFSLVEVTLAIGIVAFAFLALFGLVPTGLNVFRSAVDASIGSQIVDQAIQAAQQTDYQRLITDYSNEVKTYYDEQGNLLTDTQSNDGTPSTNDHDPRSIYTVGVKVVAPVIVPVSGSQSSGEVDPKNPNIATLTVRVAKNPGHDLYPFRDANKANFTTYTAYVARNRSAFETRNSQ